jgi:small subunit ribosomal protein S13
VQHIAHMLEDPCRGPCAAESQNIQRLKDIRCYRGIKHMKGCRFAGRTQSNARKGPRKTVAGKKSVKQLG